MNPKAKETLDIRLAKGEISTDEYRRLMNTLAQSETGGVRATLGILGQRAWFLTTYNFYAGMRTREAAHEYYKIISRARNPTAAEET